MTKTKSWLKVKGKGSGLSLYHHIVTDKRPEGSINTWNVYLSTVLESAQTLFRLILSLLRLKSVSSQASPGSPVCRTPVSPGARLDGAGGAFSWSLRCSSCRTSSVFSRWRSPGTGVTMALWTEEILIQTLINQLKTNYMIKIILVVLQTSFSRSCFSYSALSRISKAEGFSLCLYKFCKMICVFFLFPLCFDHWPK